MKRSIWIFAGITVGLVVRAGPALAQSVATPSSAIYDPFTDRVFEWVPEATLELDAVTNGQSQFEDHGTPPSGGITFEAPAPAWQSSIDRMHVFVHGKDGHVWNRFWNDTQWQWEDHGIPPSAIGSLLSAVYQTTLDRVRVFVAGVDGNLYDNFWNGSQWVWEGHGAPANGVTAASVGTVYEPAAQRVHAFVVGSDGGLYDRFTTSLGWQWEFLGFPTRDSFTGRASPIVQSATGHVHVFVNGISNGIYDVNWTGSRWSIDGIGGPPPGVAFRFGDPSAAYQTTIDRLHVFVFGNDSNLYVGSPIGGQWTWAALGLVPFIGSTPTAVYRSDADQVMAFTGDIQNNIWRFFWNGSAWQTEKTMPLTLIDPGPVLIPVKE